MAGTQGRYNGGGRGGRPPQRNNRRPAGNGRRPASKTRRKARRRSASPLMSPGFWLIVCIAVIVLILASRGCGSEEVSGGQQVNPTQETSEKGPVIIGNTEAAPQPDNGENNGANSPQNGDNGNSGNSNGNSGSNTAPPEGGNTPQQQGGNNTTPPAGSETNDPPTVEMTMLVNPGVYYVGDGKLPAGNVSITVLSGAGSISSSDGQLNPGLVSADSDPISGRNLTAGAYVTITGNLRLRVDYTRVDKADTTAIPGITDESEFYNVDGSWPLDGYYIVDPEAGNLRPGMYAVEIISGSGTFSVLRKGQSAPLEFAVSKGGDYNDTVYFLTLNAGDKVNPNGCMLTFTEMKEG